MAQVEGSGTAAVIGCPMMKDWVPDESMRFSLNTHPSLMPVLKKNWSLLSPGAIISERLPTVNGLMK